MKHLSNVVNWVEIPVRDLARAKNFYQTLFELQLAEMNVGNGLRMALLPAIFFCRSFCVIGRQK